MRVVRIYLFRIPGFLKLEAPLSELLISGKRIVILLSSYSTLFPLDFFFSEIRPIWPYEMKAVIQRAVR